MAPHPTSQVWLHESCTGASAIFGFRGTHQARHPTCYCCHSPDTGLESQDIRCSSPSFGSGLHNMCVVSTASERRSLGVVRSSHHEEAGHAAKPINFKAYERPTLPAARAHGGAAAVSLVGPLPTLAGLSPFSHLANFAALACKNEW